MATRLFHIIVEQDEDGWYVWTVTELPGCHTQAKSLDELRNRIIEAIGAYLEVAKPEPKGPAFIGLQTVEV